MGQDGKTLTLPDNAKLGVFPNALPGETDVTWAATTAPTSFPADHALTGSAYVYDFSGLNAFSSGVARPLGLSLPAGDSPWRKDIWSYDAVAKIWAKLPSATHRDTGMITAPPTGSSATVAVLEDRTVEQGIASWYCRRGCSKKYPKLHATSNDFPVGTTVRVRNDQNGRSVDVKVVSTWEGMPGRIIDLSWAAYDVLKAKNAGVTNVTVSTIPSAATVPPVPTPLPASTPTTAPAVDTESLPSLTPQPVSDATPPGVSAEAYVVADAATGKVLASRNSDEVLPIASLTKLMTAAILLDTSPNFKKVVTYTKADVTPYAYLRVKPGEKLTVGDLFYSMLVGSANNAATTLARSTGLTRAAFVAKMNAKAQAWGLSKTKFVDVNGLNPGNVSTAADYAVLANRVFHEYAVVRTASAKTAYTFKTVGGVKHTIKTTDKLITQAGNPLTITGAKTGFIDESRYTYALRTKHANGAQVVVVVLSEPTSAVRFADAATLASWAMSAFTWS